MAKNKVIKIAKRLALVSLITAGLVGVTVEVGLRMRNYLERPVNYTLIHVKQTHALRPEEFSPASRFDKYNAQCKTLDSLEDVFNSNPIDGFYPEGVRTEDCEKYNSGLRDLSERIEDPESTSISVLNAIINPTDKVQSAFAQAPAATVFSLRHNLAWNPTGTRRINEKASAEVKRDPYTNSPIVYGDREDFLLKQISKDYPAGGTFLTLYGSNHDFSDNVDRWNETHPKRKISLVVVDGKNVERKAR
ncbi:MAG: hypothetical protein WC796_03845 [Candidatus Pacearchaeota archaeon]|jgi:hypothetical protein